VTYWKKLTSKVPWKLDLLISNRECFGKKATLNIWIRYTSSTLEYFESRVLFYVDSFAIQNFPFSFGHE